MKRILPVCVAAGIVAGLLLLFGSSFGGGQHARDAGERSRRQRSKRKRKPLGPIIILTGTVHNGQTPVHNATVFLLDKEMFGGDRGRLPHVSSDAQGRWRLRTRRVKGRYLGVVHERYRHAHKDLDVIDRKVSIDFVLTPARRIVATLLDEQDHPIENQLLQLVPWPPIDHYELPDPKHRQGEHTALTESRGRGEFWVGSDGPVTIRAELDGYFPDPYVTALEADENVALIRARKGVPFPLRLVTPSGQYTGSLEVSLYAPQTGDGPRQLKRVRSVTATNGEVQGTWEPRRFGVQLKLDGLAPVWLGDHDFPAGDREDVIVDPPSWTHVRPMPRPERALYYARQPAPTGGHPDWQRLLPPEAQGLRVAAVPQRFLVTTPTHVAVTGTLDMPGPLQLTWQPGQWIQLKDREIAEGARRIVVLHETLGALPVIGRTGTRTRIGNVVLHIHVARPDDNVELGPYPAGAITIRGER